ncbi:MAG TPA: radical SAM/SPASM domain-containing protein [bacterium]|nr:radical SAM/SPASM domain-containing protein [bacterium]HQJ61484.1 radical SAM/SPASM domain-containing protein [bacterium]
MKRKFKRIYIEITNVCNLSCSFCPQTCRRKEFMSEELFLDILRQVKGYSDHLYFHIMGEPLLHPEIGLFLDICSEKGFRVNLTTNGTLIENFSDMLISKTALRQISFSLHSSECQSDANSEDYLEKIFRFILKARKKSGVLCSLRLWNISGDERSDLNNDVLSRIQRHFNTAPLKYEVNERGFELSEGVYLNFAEKFSWPDMKREEIDEYGFCHGLRDQVGILVDGTVVPCCLDSDGNIALGNINNENFSEIIEGVRTKAVYDGFSSRKAVEELCRKCGYRTRFDI